jgi:hypothetical protein
MGLVVPTSFACLALAGALASTLGGSRNALALGTLELVLFFWYVLLPVNLVLAAVHSLVLAGLERFQGSVLKRWAWLFSMLAFPPIVFAGSLIAYNGSVEVAANVLFLSALLLPFLVVYSKFAALPYGATQHLSWQTRLARFALYSAIAGVLTVLAALVRFFLLPS